MFKIIVLFIITVHPVIYGGWHFTRMWKELAKMHHFTKGVIPLKNSP